MGLKVSKNVILPRIDRIQDPEAKRVIQELLRVIQDLNATYYNDLAYLELNSGTLDYEEGTWTPVLEFGGASVGITYSIQSGLYTKIGRVVTISAYVYLISKGTSTGTAYITGLPFTCKNEDSASSPVSLKMVRITFAEAFQGQVLKNTKTIPLFEVTEAGVQTYLDNTNFEDNSYFMVSATYFTD